jgi:aminocarboxymuconate-semialdehyde decarboxylase
MTSVLDIRLPSAREQGMSATPRTTPLAARLADLPPGQIDLHTHAIDPDLPDIGQRHEGTFPVVRRTTPDRLQIFMDGRLYREVDDRCWSAEARLRDMDAEGVAAQVVSATPATLCHGEPADGARALAAAQNDFLARLAAAAPDRLLAFGCVPLQDPQAAVKELRQCIRDRGFAGVEIGTRAGDLELTDHKFAPFFRAAEELGAVVFVHPVDRTLDPRLARLKIGFGLGMPAETATAAAGIVTSGLLDEVPGLKMLLAHGGGTLPSALARLAKGQRMAGETDPERLATTRVQRLWCDSLTYDVPALRLAAERFGPDHVVLGTDYPFDAREQPAGAVLKEAGLGETEQQDKARANALALLTP